MKKGKRKNSQAAPGEAEIGIAGISEQACFEGTDGYPHPKEKD
ncbi:hypothetical protein ACFLW2_00120 [Chloroflexota bacterium]